MFYDEINLSKAIGEILNAKHEKIANDKITLAIDEVMKIHNITYSERQQEAIYKALKEPITIITGGPGTGKSTVVKGIIEAYSSLFNKKDLIKLNKVLDEYARVKGCSRQEVINNQDDLGWMNYLHIINEGDLDYIPHLMRYIDIEQFITDFGITNEQIEQIDGIDVEIVKRTK